MNKLFKTLSSLIALAVISTSAVIPAGAEVIIQEGADGDAQSMFLINVTIDECDEYKIFPNHFLIDPDDPLDMNGSRAFYSDPSIKTRIDSNIYPNKYDLIPPTYVTGDLITENNGYYKYLSDEGYENGTFEVSPNVYPYKQGICYSVEKRYKDDTLYLYLPLDADDIPKAEAFIEADDREGLYDFLAAANAVEHPDFGEINEFTSLINRDYTPVNENSVLNLYTPEQIYQKIIDNYVYPHFSYPQNATSGGAYAGPATDSLMVGDANKDGKISILDVIRINKIHAGIIRTSNAVDVYLSDINASNAVDNDDIVHLLNYVVGITDRIAEQN